MCGIFGFTNFKRDDLNKARQALNTLEHRGPDQWNDYHDENIYMGHRRLSILDLSEHGKQPMLDESENIVITVNGEIYNFQELKNELESKYQFKSTSDSEVVLYGYLEWGIKTLLEKIDGMYAISIFDKRDNSLYLVKDRFGKKPIFYIKEKERVLYSSEIKVFFEFDDKYRVFSYEGIKDWIYHRGSQNKNTIFHNIYKLTPGKYLHIQNNNINEYKYYDILDYCKQQSEETNLDELEQYLDDAVKKRLVSDVPVGLQLSGGVDSSLIGHLIKKHHTGNMHSFSVGFEEEKYSKFSEEKYARYVAKEKGFMHHQYNINKKDYINSYEKVVWLFDGMLDYPNAVPIFLLSKYAKKYITVALTGEGADELFGGYTKYKNMLKIKENSVLKNLPSFFIENVISKIIESKARALYLKKEYSGNSKKILENINCYISQETFKNIFGENKSSLFDDISYEKIKKYPFYKQLLIMDHKTYLYSLLDRQDRASMGGSIESRLPFLDRGLIEWAINLDEKYLFDNTENKKILKEYCEKILIMSLHIEKKVGFPIPIESWLFEKDGFDKYVDKIFEDDFLLIDKIDIDFLKEYISSDKFDRKNLNYADSEKMWIIWFLMVIRTTQDIFKIKDIV